ncbi:hypothetical protein MPL3365_100228 [Mesorhizobium plurifarium]|uniref:Uncharacterized protein n=1 Tax=Mesorhizobium plurifarium TaxID=69974 RepID=A0A090GSF5_MESPL|nr:hypothetical protein MPL3365_100228 [Mesorhizobium plurifarium]
MFSTSTVRCRHRRAPDVPLRRPLHASRSHPRAFRPRRSLSAGRAPPASASEGYELSDCAKAARIRLFKTTIIRDRSADGPITGLPLSLCLTQFRTENRFTLFLELLW